MSGNKALAKAEWRSGWTLVLAASIGFSFFSIMVASTGLFMEPLAAEFGWSRTFLSAGPSIATTMTAVLGPFFGVLIDRYGGRRLALPGLVVTMASISAFSLADGSTTQWIVLWLVFGIVSVSIKSTIWTAAVVGVFNESRGLALGLTLSGAAIAQTIVPPLTNFLITEFGWRASFVWLALGWGGLTFVLCALFFFDIHARASAQRASRPPEPSPSATVLPGLTVPQALRNSALWRIAVSNFVVMAFTMGLTVHLFPILTGAGVARATAALLISLGGIAGIVGKIVTGFLLDRFRPNWIGGLTLGAAALTFTLLLDGINSPIFIVIALLVNGYAAGTKTHITGYLTANYGGMRNFGVIYGFMSALMSLAAGVGPLLAGAIYDGAGSYGPFLIAGAIGCAMAGMLIVTMPERPSWEHDTRGQPLTA